MSECSSCGAEIQWVMTAAGQRMPLDADPVDGGNITVKTGPQGRIATVLTKEETAKPGSLRYLSHFATCPQADSHRRSR